MRTISTRIAHHWSAPRVAHSVDTVIAGRALEDDLVREVRHPDVLLTQETVAGEMSVIKEHLRGYRFHIHQLR